MSAMSILNLLLKESSSNLSICKIVRDVICQFLVLSDKPIATFPKEELATQLVENKQKNTMELTDLSKFSFFL